MREKQTKQVWIVLIQTLSVLMCVSCMREPTNKKEATMKTDPASFESIEINTFGESSCSPEMQEKQRGILITAPEKVEFSTEAVLPVCGTYQVSGKFLNEFYSMPNEITLIAIDMETHQSYSGNLLEKGFTPAEGSKFEGSDEELNEIGLASWFNIDLYRYLGDLPSRKTTFSIYATIGEVQSNVVQVKMIGKPSPPSAFFRADPGEVDRIVEHLTFDRMAESPLLELGFSGLIIRPFKIATKKGEISYWINGAYSIPREEGDRIEKGPLQRALVVVATSGMLNATHNLLGDRILMPDDERVEAGIRRGYFNFKLPGVEEYRGDTLYITVSLGAWISNTIIFSKDGLVLSR